MPPRSFGAVNNLDSEAPYSLQHITGNNSHDDWTTVKDRTMKKRIQNRVAQRTYRQRMKSRMAELQAKLEACERKLQSKDDDYQDEGEGDLECNAQRRGSIESSSAVDESHGETRSTHAHNSSSSTGGTTTTTTATATISNTKSIEQESFEFSNFLLPQKGNGSNATENDVEKILSSAVAYVQDNESPPPRSRGTDGAPKNRDVIMMTAPDEMEKITTQETLSKLGSGQPASFALGNDNNLTPYLDAELSPWESGAISRPIPQEVQWTDDVWPDDQRDGQSSTMSKPRNVTTLTPVSCDEAPHLHSDTAGMDTDERVRCVLSYLKAMGFENFDELVSIYYGQQFGETSFLCNEQRLSRNRRLPGVIASVFCAATEWSTWERRGFHEEILKATETMLISESLEAQNDVQSKAADILEAPRHAHPNSVALVKKSVTSKLPNLWAFMMALAACTSPVRNQDHSGAVLAAILLLQCVGRMEKSMILELVHLCL